MTNVLLFTLYVKQHLLKQRVPTPNRSNNTFSQVIIALYMLR